MKLIDKLPSIELSITSFSGFDLVHYYNSINGEFIAQRGNKFFYNIDAEQGEFTCPLPNKLLLFKLFRYGKRLARIDRGTCLYLRKHKKFFCFYHGVCYSFDIINSYLKQHHIFDFRNPLFLSSTIIEDESVVFGEYFSNTKMRSVKIYKADEAGEKIYPTYEFAENSIWHIHGVYFDKFTGNYWICTGDFDGQCRIIMVDSEFNEIESYGDGSQSWRAVSMFFLEDRVIWGMDSPLEACYVMSLDRMTGKLSRGQPMPGPIWFNKHLTDNNGLLQTSVEHLNSPGVKSKSAQLYITKDFDSWNLVGKWRKDILPIRYFRPGVLMFSDGPQTTDNFMLQGDALVGFDGKCTLAKINTEQSV